MDELERRFFDKPDTYAKAMALLGEYQWREGISWDEVESFLAGLETGEEELLEKVLLLKVEQTKNQQSQVAENQRLNDEISYLKKTIESLVNKGSGFVSETPSIKDDLTIEEILNKYYRFKQPQVKKSTLDGILSRTKLFQKIVEEFNPGIPITVTKLSGELVRHYRDTLPKIPAHRSQHSELSISGLIALNQQKVSEQTVKNSYNQIAELLSWIESEGYPITPNLKNIFSKTGRVKNKQERIPFSDEQLKLMFQSEAYKNGTIKRPSDYWLPLLGLFTGARLAELAQLRVEDIQKVDEIWIIDINESEEDGKSVKSKAGIRKVPLHDKLIELGFLDYVKKRKARKDTRLFLEEERNSQGKFDSYGKRFHTFRKSVGVEKQDGKRLDFHSFRHTVRTKLAESGTEEYLIDDIIGHESKGASIGKKVYTHTDRLPQKKAAIDTLDYKIDFSKIKAWDKHRLIQLLRDPALKKAKP